MKAKAITQRLGGHWHGYYGTAPCPVCQPDGRPDQHALSARDGDNGCVLLHCFKCGCDFAAITEALRMTSCGYGPMRSAPKPRAHAPMASSTYSSLVAQRLWSETQPSPGTIAETYLLDRGITCPMPPSLRINPRCWHKSGQDLPAMVAKVDGARGFAVHRTYLLPDGSGKALVEPNKAMLGPCAGGAVKLSDASGPLIVAEGIETGLSLACGLLDVSGAILAGLSTSGMMALNLPSEPGRIIIAPDGDIAGRNAAVGLADRAYFAGWNVSILPIPDGVDWNDILTGRAMP